MKYEETGSVRQPASSTSQVSDEPKPLLRGWFHLLGALAAIVATVAFLTATLADPPRFLSLLVFGLSMILLYTVSAVYHIGTWHGRSHIFLRALDHANIFIFIAGAYTPICVNLLTGWVRTAMLVGIWSVALVGMACSVLTLRLPRWVLSALYLGMGWISLILLPQVAQAVSLQPVLLLVVGGLFYTIGAIIYAVRWPNPFPRIFGFHELFHLFIIAGTVAVAAMIWIWVVPYPRG